jgi:hypothetical protein
VRAALRVLIKDQPRGAEIVSVSPDCIEEWALSLDDTPCLCVLFPDPSVSDRLKRPPVPYRLFAEMLKAGEELFDT